MNIVAPPYGDLWKVARIDETRVSPEQRAEIHEWITSFGLDLHRVRPTFVVTQNSEDGRYLLHLSLMAVGADGKKFVDFAADDIATDRLVFEISEFPAWLPAVSHQQANGDA